MKVPNIRSIERTFHLTGKPPYNFSENEEKRELEGKPPSKMTQKEPKFDFTRN